MEERWEGELARACMRLRREEEEEEEKEKGAEEEEEEEREKEEEKEGEEEDKEEEDKEEEEEEEGVHKVPLLSVLSLTVCCVNMWGEVLKQGRGRRGREVWGSYRVALWPYPTQAGGGGSLLPRSWADLELIRGSRLAPAGWVIIVECPVSTTHTT